MKKIMMTLCTLLAVGSGKHIDAMHGYAEPGKPVERTETGPERSGTSSKGPTGPTKGSIAEMNTHDATTHNAYDVNSPKVKATTSQPGKSFSLEMDNNPQQMAQAYGLDGSEATSGKIVHEGTQASHVLTLKDGTNIRTIFDKHSSPIKTEVINPDGSFESTSYDPSDFSKTIKSERYDSNGDLVTKESVQAQVKQATPEQRAEAQTEVKVKVAESEAVNPEMTPEIQGRVEAALAKPENVEALVEAVAPEGITAEQKSSFVKQVQEFVNSGVKSVSELFTYVKELVLPEPVEYVNKAQAPTGSAYENYGDDSSSARTSTESRGSLFNEPSRGLKAEDITRPSTPIQSTSGALKPMGKYTMPTKK